MPLVPLSLSEGVAPLDTASWSCSGFSETGDLTDADGDGIPVNATLNGTCDWSYSGSEGSVSGSWTFKNLNVQDPDDHDPEAGIKAKGEVDWSYTAGNETDTFRWEINQHDFIKQGDRYSFIYNGSLTIKTSAGTYTEDYNLSGTWTPKNPQNPWGDGTLEGASGSFSGSGPNCANGWSLQVQLTNIHY